MPCLCCVGAGVCLLVSLFVFVLIALIRLRKRTKSVAFFHPYCNAGGGGELVLWQAIRSIQQHFPQMNCFVYTGDEESSTVILANAQRTFGIGEFAKEVKFVRLRSRRLVEASQWPICTMLGQSLGSIILGFEALLNLNPEVFIDTTGYAFTLPVFRLVGSSRTAAYVHYPTISTDMLSALFSQGHSFNNRAVFARSQFLRGGKALYYRLFAKLYGWVGSFSQVTMVNSSWTRGHIDSLWGRSSSANKSSFSRLLYPPCDVGILESLPFDSRKPTILSIAQFRPEKNHALQVRAFARLLSSHPELREDNVRLVMVGGCRHNDDIMRCESLRALIKELGVQDCVFIEKNVSFERKTELFKESMLGLHTMANEHFGIGVVEFLAAGVVPVAHKSAGPLMDIVVPSLNHDFKTIGDSVGLLAATEEEYADALYLLLKMSPEDRLQLQKNGRLRAASFSTERFVTAFGHAMRDIM